MFEQSGEPVPSRELQSKPTTVHIRPHGRYKSSAGIRTVCGPALRRTGQVHVTTGPEQHIIGGFLGSIEKTRLTMAVISNAFDKRAVLDRSPMRTSQLRKDRESTNAEHARTIASLRSEVLTSAGRAAMEPRRTSIQIDGIVALRFAAAGGVAHRHRLACSIPSFPRGGAWLRAASMAGAGRLPAFGGNVGSRGSAARGIHCVAKRSSSVAGSRCGDASEMFVLSKRRQMYKSHGMAANQKAGGRGAR